jgi:PAS domain-containing protein
MTSNPEHERVQHDVEVILLKQVASYLATPIFVVDPAGDLLYYNEPAEQLLGRRFDETGEMPLAEWTTLWMPTDEQGAPIPPEENPLAVALVERHPTHKELSIRALDGRGLDITVTALPLVGQHGRNLGAVALFWENPR